MNLEQDVKWECLNEECKNVWYEDYRFVWVECPKCKSKKIKEKGKGTSHINTDHPKFGKSCFEEHLEEIDKN